MYLVQWLGTKSHIIMAKTYIIKVGRDAKTGVFIPVKEAIKKPNTTIVETIKRSK